VNGSAQQIITKYSIRDGNMVIGIGKNIPVKELEAFIQSYDLAELDLKTFLKTNNPDSLIKLGWKIEVNNKDLLVLSKPLFSMDMKGDPSGRIVFAERRPSKEDIMPAENTKVFYGYNKFRNKKAFYINDSIVTFYLRNNIKAKEVLLAGSFSNWQQNAFPMIKTDSGWIARVKLGAGKHWYKFIIDGRWVTDADNLLNENDGRGNVNSVYYKTNVNFAMSNNKAARKIYLAGSFNNWREKELQMQQTATGWELPMYIPEGTHTYKFIVDGNWYADAKNPDKLPDGAGGYNSVLQLGHPFTFRLPGYTNAKRVILSGSFNGWKEDELSMQKTATGWQLPYVIAPGNYEYKFIVDGEWIADPSNPLKGNDGNSFVVIQPNYTFRIKEPAAKKINLAGDFNDWNPNSLPMKKEGDNWTFSVYLSPGKHLYKFLVDSEWIKDPANKLWEENEFGTGNSVIWIEQ
jgi:hypothetical protein